MSVAWSVGHVAAGGDIHTIVDLRRALAQVCPALRIVEEAVLVGSLGRPHYTGRGAGRIKSGVRLVTFVGITELFVNVGLLF